MTNHNMGVSSTGRMDRLRQMFDENIPSLLISAVSNIRYLLDAPTMFDADFGGRLLVTGTDAWLFVDGRYTGQAEAACLPCAVVGWSKSLWGTIASTAAAAGIKRAGYEPSYVTMAQWRTMKDELKLELAPAGGLVEKLRIKKEPAEIDALAHAALLGDRVFLKLIETLRPGLREREVAADIDYWLRRAGAQGPSFDTIVASGPNSAFPHAGAGERRLESGDFVKLDFGGVFGGFHADMTRTVVLGKATDEQKELYRDVFEAQSRVLAALAPGVSGRDADGVAREYFESIGKAGYFGHNLGHGVGLDVHEQPTLGSKSSAELECGMVFTVEPGLYYPAVGGVRIEDMVVMCEHGIQILTSSTKELLEL